MERALDAFQASSAVDDRALLVLRYAGDQVAALKLSPAKPISRMS